MRTFHFIFGTPRCGSTFLQDRLSRAGIGVYEPTGASAFQGIGAGTNPYASLLDETHPHLRQHPQCAVVVKEVLDDVLRAYLTSQGHTLTSWVGPALLQQARTVWIFREPSAVWRSIRAQGWDQTYHPFETFKTFYGHAMASYQAMLAAYPTQVGVVTYERLMHNPATAEVWQTAFGQDFGGMAQGDNKTGQKGTNSIFVMMHDKIKLIPKNRTVAYTCVVVDF